MGLTAMKAGQAAKRQGSKPFEAFHLELLKASHERRKKMSDPTAITDVANSSGLDIVRFQKDLADRQIVEELGESHTRAVEDHGVFGVPTFVFPNGASAYLKMFRPSEDKAVQVFESLRTVMEDWKNLGEIKRPQPPWPKGAFT